MLTATGLTKRYERGPLALDHLDLEVRPGEIYCLLGANGAGKTTTINLFLGFITPTDGRAMIDGVEVEKDPLKAKRSVSFVSENVMLYGNLTALQNLAFFAGLGGRRSSGTRYDLSELLDRAGLDRPYHTARVGTFSKGMRQRLGIAIALSKNSTSVLLDEPTSGLDPLAANEFLELIRELKRQEKAIFMSTHDVFRAREIADRIGIMRNGRLVTEVAHEALISTNLEQLYLECMAMESGA